MNKEILLVMTDKQFDMYCRNAIINKSIELAVLAENDFPLIVCIETAKQLQTMNEEILAIQKEREARK
ncbi:hypothetical protein LC593_23385 [Nostoc sp. CHAB 5844]|nr:hypothetical protein [Nostoc sp. CHAB 5844]